MHKVPFCDLFAVDTEESSFGDLQRSGRSLQTATEFQAVGTWRGF